MAKKVNLKDMEIVVQGEMKNKKFSNKPQLKKLTVVVPADLHKQLKIASIKQEKTITSIVYEGIKQVLQTQTSG